MIRFWRSRDYSEITSSRFSWLNSHRAMVVVLYRLHKICSRPGANRPQHVRLLYRLFSSAASWNLRP